MKKILIIAICLFSGASALADVVAMYARANNVLAAQPELQGYIEYSRVKPSTYNQAPTEPLMQHIIAFLDAQGKIIFMQKYNTDDNYRYEGLQGIPYMSESQFRNAHIIPYGGDYLNGDPVGSTTPNPGSNGGNNGSGGNNGGNNGGPPTNPPHGSPDHHHGFNCTGGGYDSMS